MLILKAIILVLLVTWTLIGVWMAIRYTTLFGPHRDDPAESAGARSFGVAHMIAVWVFGEALGIYFLFQ
ncbi:hypothetical protein [Rubritalea marina]|uniref:hypothetical protein n=1 Tax=Rubritalea marina TaxID=361055 RepID=UPI0003760F97|nr:hypothetical protein [Rubritalea marina]